MREIKFRGKSVDEWVYGFLLKTNKFDLEHGEDIKYSIQTDNSKYGEYEKCFITEDDTIEQYTGLKDKNGTEIYEGDIVNIFPEKAVVEYSENDSGFILKPIGEYYFDSSMLAHNKDLTIEVIGNIHDNPELIK